MRRALWAGAYVRGHGADAQLAGRAGPLRAAARPVDALLRLQRRARGRAEGARSPTGWSRAPAAATSGSPGAGPAGACTGVARTADGSTLSSRPRPGPSDVSDRRSVQRCREPGVTSRRPLGWHRFPAERITRWPTLRSARLVLAAAAGLAVLTACSAPGEEAQEHRRHDQRQGQQQGQAAAATSPRKRRIAAVGGHDPGARDHHARRRRPDRVPLRCRRRQPAGVDTAPVSARGGGCP